MIIQESAENYLESILILKKEHGYVRSIDISHHLNVTKPSVSRAVKQFKENGYITIAENGYIELTPKGLSLATSVYDKHVTITDFLVKIGVDKAVAAQEACRIEHVISEGTFEKLKTHIEEIDK